MFHIWRLLRSFGKFNGIMSSIYALRYIIRCPQLSTNISHLTHWGPVTHICVSKQTIIGSDNGLSPGRHQAIIWTNDGILLIGTSGTNFSEILI